MTKILCDNESLSPLEELFIRTTIGATFRYFEGDILEASVHFRDSLEEDSAGVICQVDVCTHFGQVGIRSDAPSRIQAFMRCAEQLDRRLTSALLEASRPGDFAPSLTV